jgi:hypothetical protein
MTFDLAHPLVKASAVFAGVAFLVLMAVAAPSVVIADAPQSDTTIDPALMRVARSRPLPLANYTIVVAEPLFNEGRRADPLPPPPAPPKPPPLPGVESYRLAGLVLSPEVRLALVSRPQGGELVRLHPGDLLDGWTVEAVDATGVTLSGQGITAHMKVTRAPQNPDQRPAEPQTAAPENSAARP